MAELSEVPDTDKHLISTPANIRVKTVALSIGVSNIGSSMINLMKYNKAKCQVLYLSWDNP